MTKFGGLVRRLRRDSGGQAVAEFSIVVLLLLLVLFSIVETGFVLNDKMVLTSTAREVARVCAVEGGRTANAVERLEELLSSAGIDPDRVDSKIHPTQAIYGTTICVELSYDYRIKSPLLSVITGSLIPLSASAITRSEFVPR